MTENKTSVSTGSPFESALTALRNGASYSLCGTSLTINDVPMTISDAEFDRVWNVLNEIEGDDWMVGLTTDELGSSPRWEP